MFLENSLRGKEVHTFSGLFFPVPFLEDGEKNSLVSCWTLLSVGS